jgi:hypothetical protein
LAAASSQAITTGPSKLASPRMGKAESVTTPLTPTPRTPVRTTVVGCTSIHVTAP